MSARPRVLLTITVYNGEAFVARTLESAQGIDDSEAEIDILVLDDASPAPGWSGRLSKICADMGIGYYCAPRNLGIPRNVSLGLVTAMERGYDYVVISNSDVIYPSNLISQLLRVSRQENVGSVTAWSNNVSMYSLENAEPDRLLADQEVVNRISASLEGHYGDSAMDIPAGISFAMLISTDVLRDVGIMDPVFGRGYCEETDWSLRSLAAGYRIALAPGTFVYHAGRGSNIDAGLVSGQNTSVPENEAIIDLRYPMFRSQIVSFASSGILKKARKYAVATIVQNAGAELGYVVDIGWLPPTPRADDVVRCTVAPDGLDEIVKIEYRGFTHVMDIDPFHIMEGLAEFFFGRAPDRVNVRDRGKLATVIAEQFPDLTARTGNYPARV